MGLDEKGGKLTVPVAKVIPPEYVGQGSGGARADLIIVCKMV
jgi:hypothetical protein